MKKVLIIMLFLVLSSETVSAKPWWWAQFSKADKTSVHSNFEKWHAYFIDSADPQDKVYVQSMAWDSANNGTINWITGDNSVGLNRLATQIGRTAPLRILGDINYDAVKWEYIRDTVKHPSIGMVGSNKSYLTHSKICYVQNKGVIISSANHNRNGFNYQHNDSIMLWHEEFPDMMAKIEQELDDEFDGFFHAQTSTGNIYHYSPYGDTVEMRFSPDDNNNGLEVGAESIVGRLRYLIENAQESIIYMANAWGSSNADPEANAGNKIKDSIINNNRAFKIGAKGSYSLGVVQRDLMNDHTCRIASPMNDQHSKIMVIDMDIVACGSANFSDAAMLKRNQNDETHIIIHDFRLARRYMGNFHHIMGKLSPENNGAPDNYNTMPPGKPSNLSVTPSENSFALNWTAPVTNTQNFSRYYIFIDSNPISTNFDIGDRIDNDGDGYYDEDPVGNIDRFSIAGIFDDDDGDGLIDEDPWLFPEMQIKNINQTNATLYTSNVGDSLLPNVNYWFAVVAVDTQGNESICDTSGPHQLLLTGAQTIIITEIMYDSGNDTDWLEIYNNGTEDIDLSGWKVIDGNDRHNLMTVLNNINGAGSWTIKPGQYAIISPYAEQWYARYNDTPPILIDSVNALSFNITSQLIGLFSSSNDTVTAFYYPNKAVTGHSIELMDLYANPALDASWQSSDEYLDISPGQANTIICYTSGPDTNIVITEVMYDVPVGFLESSDEWVEIYNRGSDTVSLSGWQFGYWSGGSWTKRKLSAIVGDLLIAPYEYAVLHESAELWHSKGYGDTPAVLIDLLGSIDLIAGNTIALFNYNGVIIEEFIFPNIAVDKSIERKNPNLADYTSVNWEASNTTGGETHTGGRTNTVAPPSLQILAPQNNIDTYTQTIILAATTLNSWAGDTIVIYLNGANVEQFNLGSINESWQKNITLTGVGDTIAVVLYEQLGRTAADTIIINYYQPLEISVDLIFTEYDSMIKPLYIDIKTFGSAQGDTIYIFNEIANETRTIDVTELNGAYYDTIVLNDYGDTLRVSVVDKFGRTDSGYITVYYYPNIEIGITAPENYDDTIAGFITISGTTLGTDRGCTVVIYNSGVAGCTTILTNLNSSWSGTIALTGNYQDTITVKLFDRFTRIAFDTIFVNYFPEQSVKINTPIDNQDTNIQIIILSGTTDESRQNDTITIFLHCIETTYEQGYDNDTIAIYEIRTYKESEFLITTTNGAWSATASLTDQGNSVTVQLTDRFGRSVYDTITVNYFGAASIMIESPWYDYDTTANQLSVSGITYNSRAGDTAEIFVNGILQDSYILTDNNGEWSGDAYISGISDSLIVKLTSQWGGIICDTIPVNYFDTISIGITSPQNNTDTTLQSIVLFGTTYGVNGPDKIELYLNNDFLNRKDVYYVYEKNETWTLNVNLQGYGDTLTVKLTDQFGRIAWDTININYIGVPSIKITAPQNLTDTIVNIISVSGTTLNTQAGDTIQIYVNEVISCQLSVASQNGIWNGTASVNAYADKIIVKLTDKFGRITYDTITVNYYDTPVILINLPAYGAGNRYDTTASNIIIGGTTSVILTNDSVYIFLNNDTYSIVELLSNQWNDTFSTSENIDTIVVKITDFYGRSAYDTIIIGPGFVISGYVICEGKEEDSAGVEIMIYNETDSASAVTNETGYFSLRISNQDTYYISFDRSVYLKQTNIIFVAGSEIISTPITLKAGDFFKDGKIDIKDAAVIKKYFGRSAPEYDIDGDGNVGAVEKDFLMKNFER